MDIKLSKEFETRLMNLKCHGKKIQYQQAMTVISELGLEVDITKAFKRETRIPNCYKYELPEGYRMVFQKVEDSNLMLALFIGSHADTDSFLDRSRGWIFDPRTFRLKELRLGTFEMEQINVVTSPDVRDKKPIVEQKIPNIFNKLTEEMLIRAGVPPDKIKQIASFTEPDSIEVMMFLDSLNQRTTDLLLAYITGNADTQNEIIELLQGKRQYFTHLTKELVEAINAATDEYIEIRELQEEQLAFESLPLDDWMLFLHPDQKSFVMKNFNGPIRLRGVSGSGKTVVAIHKARQLARESLHACKNEYVLFLTFNRSLADLVQNLINQFCLTSERKLIQVSTIDKWCRDFIKFRLGGVSTWDDSIVEIAWISSFRKHISDLVNIGLYRGPQEVVLNPVEFQWHRFTRAYSRYRPLPV